MSNQKEKFNQVLEDLEIDASDMMDDPPAFITRVIAKSKELSEQLDAKSSMAESERKFKERALKDTEAKEIAQDIFNNFYDIIVEQPPEVLVNIMALFPELMSTCNSSIRSMSMRSGNVTTLSKKQVNLLYIKLKNTYETYIEFMKLFQADKIGKYPPVIPPKKGNFSDYSVSGIKAYEFIIDGISYVNPYPVAKKLGIEMKHYMDLPDKIRALQGDDPDALINEHTVKLVDISKGTEEE